MHDFAGAMTALTAPGAPFEMVALDRPDGPVRAYRHAKANLLEIFEAQDCGGRDAIVYLDERFTFDAVRGRVVQVAGALASSGVGKGDSVAVAMRNLPEMAFAFWACMCLGAVFVPLNGWWVGKELGFAIADSEARILLVDSERLSRLEPEVLSKLDLIVVTRQGGPIEISAPAIAWPDFVARGGAVPTVDIHPDDPATMLYTSGTTGRPKAAISTHRNHCSNIMNTMFFGVLARTLSLSSDPAKAVAVQPAGLLPFPMFHIGGLSSLYNNWFFGSKLVMLYKWSAEEALRLIAKENVSTIALAPAMLQQIIESPDFSSTDLSSLTAFAVGAAPVPPELAREAGRKLGPAVTPTIGYGLTEATSGVTANTGVIYAQNPDSVGPPLPVIDLRIVGEGEKDAAVGQPGEIWVRGPNVIAGYWRRPDANADSFSPGGWFRTGDIGKLDEQGLLYIVDRLKDVIIRGGENIYCAEVEAALTEHPAVYEAAVVGYTDPVLGERVAAVVVVRPDHAIKTDDLQVFTRTQLAYFKVPEKIILQTEPLERNATGKVVKTLLKQRFATLR